MHYISKPKIVVLLILLISIFTFSGCNMLGRAGQLTQLTQTESVKIREMSDKIIHCFKENDQEGLKNLFCEKIRNDPDFNRQLAEAFKYLKGRINDWDIQTTASGGQSVEYGKIKEWDVSPQIRYVKTIGNDITGSHVYDITYHWKIVNEKDKTLEGLQVITITLLNVDKFTLGKNLESWAK
jgi:hypothetical protein